jgi:hypothetical protein
MSDILTSIKNYEETHKTRFSRIILNFPKDILKILYVNALEVDEVDNNIKADYVKATLMPLGFSELGTGTNRIAMFKDGYVYKIALDRNGIVDNFSEYKWAPSAPEYLAKAYEFNLIILVSEYVTLMERFDFIQQRGQIKLILDQLTRAFIIGDLGLTEKNFCNFGYRSNGAIVALDYAYIHPIRGNEDALKCNHCGKPIVYTSNYSGFECSNEMCKIPYQYIDIKRQMPNLYETVENMALADIYKLNIPDFNKMMENITKSHTVR